MCIVCIFYLYVLLQGLFFKVSLLPAFSWAQTLPGGGEKGGKPVQVRPACQHCPLSSLSNWTWNGWWEKAESIRLGCLTLQWAVLIWKKVKRQRGSCSDDEPGMEVSFWCFAGHTAEKSKKLVWSNGWAFFMVKEPLSKSFWEVRWGAQVNGQ